MQSALAEVRREGIAISRENAPAMIQRWHEANAAWLAAHLQLAKQQSVEDAANLEPGEIIIEIPADASAEKRAFLHASAAILDEMAELQDRYRDASDLQRQRGVAQWMETNAARLAAHYAEAKRLSVN